MTRNGRNPKSPAFQWYAPDALTDGVFAEMTLEERGAFITLLSYAWINGGIPVEPDRIRRLLRADRAQFARLWPQVSKSFSESDGRLVNCRLEREREFQSENRARRKAASDAANAEKARKSVTESVTESDPIQSPVGGVTRPPSPVPLTRPPSPVPRLPTPDENTSPADEPPGVSKPKPDRKPASGVNAECIRHWEAEWSRTRLGTRYAIQKKDGVAVAWMLRQEDAQEVRQRMTAILEDTDPWITKSASLSLLHSKWDQWAVRITGAQARNGKTDMAALWRSQKGGAQ